MASYSAQRSTTQTLSGTTEDVVTITQIWPALDVTNHSSTNKLYFRQDGQTAVAAADNTTVVMPLQSKVVAAEAFDTSGDGKPDGHRINIVGTGNAYTIEGCQ